MIRINLLPEKEGKKRPRAAVERATSPRQVSPLTIVILAGMVVAIGGFYYFAAVKPLKGKEEKASRLKAKEAELDKEINSIKGSVEILKVSESITRSMLDIVDALDPEDRLLWSQKLNEISDLVPDNVYITRIKVDEAIKQRETVNSLRRHKEWMEAYGTKKKRARVKGPVPAEPPRIYYPEIVQTLTIQAVAHAENEEERMRLINQFWDNLDTGVNEKTEVRTEFPSGFDGSPQYGNMTPKEIQAHRVKEFSFVLRTQPTRPKRNEAAGGS